MIKLPFIGYIKLDCGIKSNIKDKRMVAIRGDGIYGLYFPKSERELSLVIY